MHILTKEEILRQEGRFILLYGPTGCGKTTSILQSAPMPILYIGTEPRSLAPSIQAAGRKDLDLDCVAYENFSALVEFVSDSQNFVRHRTICLDSLSHLMINLASEIEAESYDAKSENEKAVKPLINQTKLSLEAYGGIASQAFRIMGALGRLSRGGKIVTLTALLAENPKYNRSLGAAPFLKGKEFPTGMPSYLDLIGLVSSRTDAEGRVIYPPLVRFQSADDSFIAKYTGPPGGKVQGLFNIEKILQIKKEERR